MTADNIELKQRVIVKNYRPIMCEQTGKMTETLGEMAKLIDVSKQLIHMQLHGVRPHAKGYTFRFLTYEEIGKYFNRG